MTITVEAMRKDMSGFVLRLKSGEALSLGNWWIMQMEAEEIYLLDRGDWGGPAFYFKLGDEGKCIANTEEGWVEIGVFEAVERKGGKSDEATAEKANESGPASGHEGPG